MVEFALTQAHRLRLARAFRASPRVDISIDCVVEGQMGRAFVDDVHDPTAFVMQLGVFCYFAGEAKSPGGRAIVESQSPPKLLMPSPPEWIEIAQDIHRGRLFETSRYSFSSEHLSTEHLERLLRGSPLRDQAQRIDGTIAARAPADPDGVVDISEFDSAEDFVERGIGFCLLDGETIAGAAYSSLVCSKGIEISLFVLPAYRRRGVATTLGSMLVKHCLESGMDPHWDAANPESCKLAEKLGYVRTGTYEAYYLSG
jgi:GNAT superfamily N-acetyltransferase